MQARTPFASRLAALFLALLVAMHLLITLDLFFKFFPATPEFLAMWGISVWAKVLWAATCEAGNSAASAIKQARRKPTRCIWRAGCWCLPRCRRRCWPLRRS